MSAPARPSTHASLRVVQVFPHTAHLSSGPSNAIIAFMASQLQAGLDVRAVSPIDTNLPSGRHRPLGDLPIIEFDSSSDDVALAEANTRTVFHFHGLSPWSDRMGRRLKEKSIPYVFTSHGQLHFHGAGHGFKKLVYLNALNPFIRAAGGLHFLTGKEKDRSRFILPFWRKPVLIQPNLISLPDVQAIPPADRAELGIPADAFIFAYLGRLDIRHKGLDILVRAFSEVSRRANARLLVIGPDFEGGRSFLEQLAQELGCAKQIHFLGPQAGDAKWSLLKLAHAFVSPSRWEACSIAQAEALGLGLPTIVSDQVNMASEWTAGGIALVSPLSPGALAQAMQRVIADAALRDSLSKAGRHWVAEACSPGPAGARFAEFYERILPG